MRRTTFRVAILLITALVCSAASTAAAEDFDPELVISDDNMRAANSMSPSEIQQFLETLPGPLATLKTRDYDQVITLSKKTDNLNITPDTGEEPKLASQIIWEACQAWQISPKVMLTMLQKEQSLLTRTSLATNTLARAVGAGCPGSLVFPDTNPVATNRYPGFGNQVWHGARLLDSYGEGHTYYPTYYEGITHKIYKDPVYGTTIRPKNLATFKLYVYNPSIPGNTNFYNIYRLYFGSTFAKPTMREMWAFRNRYNGNYYYTGSIAQRHKLRSYPSSNKWKYAGHVFTWDASVPTTQSTPVWAFKRKSNGKYSYTATKSTYEARRSATGRLTWEYKGVAFRAAKSTSAGARNLYLLRNRLTGGRLLTYSPSTRDRLKADRRTWEYLGVKYYLPRAPAPSTPTSPTPEPSSTPEPTTAP